MAERLGELRFLGFHPPKQLLAFARELGAAASLPRAYVLEVWEERGFGSPGGLKSQLEEGGKRRIKAAQLSGPHVLSQACRSSSEGSVRAWRSCVPCPAAAEMRSGRAAPRGIRALGRSANPCSDSSPRGVPDTPCVCWVLCRKEQAWVHGEQGQRAQPERGFASYLCISLSRRPFQASPGAQSHRACQQLCILQDLALSSLPFPRRCSLRSVSSPSEGNTPAWPRCVYPK